MHPTSSAPILPLSRLSLAVKRSPISAQTTPKELLEKSSGSSEAWDIWRSSPTALPPRKSPVLAKAAKSASSSAKPQQQEKARRPFTTEDGDIQRGSSVKPRVLCGERFSLRTLR